MSYEFPFLEEVYKPVGQHKIDFVFVHGLNPRGRNEHPFETWTHENGAFWPTSFLASDIPYARIFVYGYNSNISNPQVMSTATVKDHANTLLNLLDLERGASQTASPSKIIFIGHSLGGLVIKQALLNAHENPKYNAIRNATFGLVFFGCPHHGAKGAELGNVAAKVARFISNGRASNDLLECLKHDSLFTRQMSDRFRHQLEDYRVVSFIEGKPVQFGGSGPTSVSHLIVDEESAVLGLTGLRETQLKLDADHSQMCKIAAKGAMYKMIKGNIQQLVDQAILSMEGYIPPPTVYPAPSLQTPPQQTPTLYSSSSSPYPFQQLDLRSTSPYPSQQPYPRSTSPYPSQQLQGSTPTIASVIGTMYPQEGTDPRSVQLAEHKNKGRWDEAIRVEYQIFEEHRRTLGDENPTTLATGNNLSVAYLESCSLDDAARWSNWVSSNGRRTLGPKHRLVMKADSVMGEILMEKGQYHEAETGCASVLASQQDYLGDEHLDTLETQRRIGLMCHAAGRPQDALVRLQKRETTLKRLLGENHIQVLAASLDVVEVMLPSPLADQYGLISLGGQVQHASRILPPVYQQLRVALGPQHPLTIRALRVCGIVKSLEGQKTEASDTLRRALSNAEEFLGPNHPETINIVGQIGILYVKKSPSLSIYGSSDSNSAEARPWLQRYLNWVETHKGRNHPEVQSALQLLAMSYMEAGDMAKAEEYFERLLLILQAQNSPQAQEVQSMLQMCKLTNYARGGYNTGDISSLLLGGPGFQYPRF